MSADLPRRSPAAHDLVQGWEFRPQIGAYYLTSLPGIWGALIRIGQAIIGDWSRYTHAGMFVGPVNGVPMCVEALGRGVTLTPLAEVMARKHVAWEVDHIDSAAGRIMADAAKGDVGDGYGWLTYLGLAARTFNVRAPRLRAAIARSTHTICSQGVMRWKAAAGVRLIALDQEPANTTPGDLANAGTVKHMGSGPFYIEE